MKAEQSHATIPPPSDHERELAAQWAQNNAVEAIAQLMAEARWLRNMTHPKGTDDE